MLAALILLASGCSGLPEPSPETLAGSASCRPCHEDFYLKWAPSRHGTAMQEFRADLPGLKPMTGPLQVGDRSYLVQLGPTDGRVVEEDASGTQRQFELKFALGGKNVYYFLTELDRGRLQVLPVAFDVREDAWFDTTGSMVRHFHDRADEALDWREAPLTFNTSCHSCHVSLLQTNYDPEADIYHTTWHEPGISCETCHGPGLEHVRVCEAAPEGTVPQDLKIISTTRFTVAQQNDACAPCHAKMVPLTDAYPPGEPYFDHFGLAALEDPDFYPDGRDLGENYTWTHWLMNPCAASGELSCVHCHTSSGRDRNAADPDQACAPCHQAYVDDPTPHTFHKAESEGSRCITCHMPRTTFARMVRHDHTHLPPIPAATVEFGSPNACNLCHQDQSPEWSDRWSRRWWGDYQDPYLARARLVDAARRQDWSALPRILAYLESPDRDPVFTASLVRLLANCPDPARQPALLKLTGDPSPLVRSAVMWTLGLPFGEPERDALLRAAADPLRVVRLAAAARLASVPPGALPAEAAGTVQSALAEYETSLRVRPDQWTSPYNLGNLYLETGRPGQAVDSYRRAVRMRPDLAAPRVNGAMALARLGRLAEAEEWLSDALRQEPDSAAAHYNLGLLLAERGRPEQAEAHLRQAADGPAPVPEAAINLAVLLGEQGKPEALEWARRAYERLPEDGRAGYVLAFYLARFNQPAAAVKVLQQQVEKGHADESSRALLSQLQTHLSQQEEMGNRRER